ncbi:AIM24 family protein [Nocardioides sp. AE5]|uniref:AIM24 family protein n=1 Tax=Nocardioides sp. AE5 TaxID=2962573 RepID=UPI002881BFE6|nr:AIM24 family protein [Nocardioides sp. AE5]MDT0202438.1 AIM24 family protein [Nocardioides sp. AE5]
MKSDLFDQSNLRVNSQERFALQNDHMLRVGLGPDVLATKGAMVAYTGQVQFHHEKSGSMAKLAKKIVTSEDVSLMRVSGQGEVYFASDAGYVFLLELENEGISTNFRNLLAFDASLTWDINRTKGAGIMTGGFFNTTVGGTGTVAVSSVGKPVVLDCSQQPVYVDPNSTVCWSASLSPGVHNSMNMSSMLRGGSGEAIQYVFHGAGFVVVQAYEWTPVSTGR